MKKFLMTIAAVFAAVNMNAQYYVGGNVGFSSDSEKGNPAAEKTITGFNISPEIGMTLDEKMGVGIVLDFNSTKTEIENKTLGTSSDTTTTRFGLSPYVRYQFFKVAQFNVFLDGGVDFVFNALYYDDTCKSILSKYEQYIAIKDDKVFLCWEKDNGVLDFELIDKGVMLDDK